MDEKSNERTSYKVTVPEIVVEEMTSRTVLKVTHEGCLGGTI